MYNNVYFNNFIFIVYTQSYNQPQPQQPSLEECGVQDKDELPDFHAAAPWGIVRLTDILVICCNKNFYFHFHFIFFCISDISIAAALFYVDGDLFQKQLNSQYLSTAIFISKRLAITSKTQFTVILAPFTYAVSVISQ